MIALTYRLELLQPVLASVPGGDPNSIVSLPYIPGSLIRGAVGSRIYQSGKYTDLTVDARDLLLNGQTRFLNAYPFAMNKGRALPIPLSWVEEKSATSLWKLVEDYALDSEGKIDTPKGMSGWMWLQESDADDDVSTTAYKHSPQWQIAIHTRRDAGAGRPIADSGAVFRYEALAAGQQFEGAILFENSSDAKEIAKHLSSGRAYIGGSRSAGYGLVEFADIKEVSEWHEASEPQKEISAEKCFTLTLLSNTQLRNQYGATHTQMAEALEQHDIKVIQKKSFKKTLIFGGFSQVWGMPLPQERILAAGSVFVLEAKEVIPLEKLAALSDRGIGERRTKGFGRVAINWPNIDELTYRNAESAVVSDAPYALPENSPKHLQEMAQRMATRRYHQDLDLALAKAVKARRISRAPTNSQLSRMRTLVRNAANDSDLSRISHLFKEPPLAENGAARSASGTADAREHDEALKARSTVLRANALKKFQTARISTDGKRLADWIEALADDPNLVWGYIQATNKTYSLGGVQPDKSQLAMEYAARLIDGVLGQEVSSRRFPEGAQGTKEEEANLRGER